MSKRFENTEDFIAKYKVAHTNKLKLEEFAWLMGIKPKSVARRKLSVKHHSGFELPELSRYEPNVKKSHAMRPSDEDINNYEVGLAKIQKTQGKFVMEVHENVNKKKKATYIVTSAQNATPVHENFLKCLENYAQINDAQIMVIPYRYRNPTSIWNFNNTDHEWWDSKLKNYTLENHIKLNDHLRVMAQISIQPTATRPLSGFDHVTGQDSAIFGHPSIEQKTIPTPAQKLPKILTSTGAVTTPNYTDSKAGHKGEFNHCLAAVVVEIEGDRFYIRHVHGDRHTGAFYDKDTLYTIEGAENGHRVAALVTGDIHAEFHDPSVEAATYTDKNSIMNVLNPEVWVLHDLEDFYRRNHHHRGNDIIAFGKHHYGRNNVEDGLQISADFVDRHSRKNMVNLIVKSNHDEALDRWLGEADPKSDPENAVLYHYLKYHQYKSVRMSRTGFKSFDPFKFWCENPESRPGLRNIENTHFLERDESFVIAGIEIGFHGDKGPNGARGSINNFSKIGPKTIIGHSHSPGIFHGTYQVGVSAYTDLEYASGPSSWMQTHCVVYPDGSRTLIHIVKGKWTF